MITNTITTAAFDHIAGEWPSTPTSTPRPDPCSSRSDPGSSRLLLDRKLATPGSPGTWRHPKIGEVMRRRHAGVFSERHAMGILHSTAAIFACWVLNMIVCSLGRFKLLAPFVYHYWIYVYVVLLALPIANIAVNLLPLRNKLDDVADIPLTETQRKLMGLPPSPAKPASPGRARSASPTPPVAYQSPPRYSPTLIGSIVRDKKEAIMNASIRSKSSPPPAKKCRPDPSLDWFGHRKSDHYGSPLPRKPIHFPDRRPRPRGYSFGPPPRGEWGLGSRQNNWSLALIDGQIPLPEEPGPLTLPVFNKDATVPLTNKWLFERKRKTTSTYWEA